MAFADKTDWLGLGDDKIKLRSNSDGASNGNLEIVGKNGDIICNQTYGHVKNPTCDYVICGQENFSKTLGTVHASSLGNYALQSYSITTGAGQEPTLNATGV